MNIKGVLPNAIFTLAPSPTSALLFATKTHDNPTSIPTLAFLCAKFFTVWRDQETETYTDCGTDVDLCGSRLFARGSNVHGGCCVSPLTHAFLTKPAWIRLPPVLSVYWGEGSWLANTTRGLYAWGRNDSNRLGNAPQIIEKPILIMTDHVTSVWCFDYVTIIGTKTSWVAFGNDMVDVIKYNVAGPGASWYSHHMAVFAWTADGRVLAGGWNECGQLGAGQSVGWTVSPLTPVALPDGVKGRVDRIYTEGSSTFFFVGTRCFACGYNNHGQLGVGIEGHDIITPTEVPLPVSDVATFGSTTIFTTPDRQFMICGPTPPHFDSTLPHSPTPAPLLDVPDKAVGLILCEKFIIFLHSDGRCSVVGAPARILLGLSLYVSLNIPIPRPVRHVMTGAAEYIAFITRHGAWRANSDAYEEFRALGPVAPGERVGLLCNMKMLMLPDE